MADSIRTPTHTVDDSPGEGSPAYRRRALIVLTLIYTCANVDRHVMSVVLEPIKREFGLSDSQLGLLAGMAFAVAFAVMALPLGYLIDRTNRVRLLAGLLAVWSAFTVACSQAGSFVTMVLWRGGVGAAESGASPASLALLSDIFPARQRSTAIGVFNASSALGVLLSFGIGGYIAQHHGWRSALLLAGLPGLLLAILMLGLMREPRPAQAGDAGDAPSVREVYSFIFSQRALLHMLAGVMLVATINAGVVSWLAPFLSRVHGLEVRQGGMVVALTLGVFGSIGPILGGWLADRAADRGGPQQRARIAALGAAMMLPIGLAVLLSDSLRVAIPALAAFGMAALFFIGPSYALVLSLVAPRMRGMTAATLQILANLVGTGFGPTLVGLLSDRLGGGVALRQAMACVLLLSLWAAWHFLRATRHLERDLARAARPAAA